jgi:hypothetical protein
MLGDDESAKLRGVISIPDWVTAIVEDGDDNFELHLDNLGDNVEDDNTLEGVGSYTETLILLKFSFKVSVDEDEAASNDDS